MKLSRRLAPRDERGAIGGAEGLVFGVLLFVFGTLIVIYAWGTVDAKMAAVAAAREATRAYVESTNTATATNAAQSAAVETMRGHDHELVGMTIETETPGPELARCSEVVIGVTTRVRYIAIPLLKQAARTVDVRAEHSEIVDPYRSGLPGSSNC